MSTFPYDPVQPGDRSFRPMLRLARNLEHFARYVETAKAERLDIDWGEDGEPDIGPIWMCDVGLKYQDYVGWEELCPSLIAAGLIDEVGWWLELNKSLEHAALFRQQMRELVKETEEFGAGLVAAAKGEDGWTDGTADGIARTALKILAVRMACYLRELAAVAGGPATNRCMDARIMVVLPDDADPYSGDDDAVVKARGVPAAEANVKARQFIKQYVNEHRRLPSARDVSKAVGCAVGLVPNLPAWRRVQDAVAQGRKVTPGTVRLTDKMMKTTGSRDQALDDLLHEHDRDEEPSPLDDDPPADRDGRPRTARVYRRP